MPTVLCLLSITQVLLLLRYLSILWIHEPSDFIQTELVRGKDLREPVCGTSLYREETKPGIRVRIRIFSVHNLFLELKHIKLHKEQNFFYREAVFSILVKKTRI